MKAEMTVTEANEMLTAELGRLLNHIRDTHQAVEQVAHAVAGEQRQLESLREEVGTLRQEAARYKQDVATSEKLRAYLRT